MNMNCERNRRKTFANWRNSPVSIAELAQSGFYATGNNFETKCHWCHQIINDWIAEDQILERHTRLSPNCPAAQCLFPTNCTLRGLPVNGLVSINPRNDIPSTSRDVLDTTMVINTENETCTQGAEFIGDNMNEEKPDMKNEKSRLATFKYWPNPNVSPEALSKAGFYYINQSDQVKCAWCKGIIAKWEKDDNAFDEHQRFFPECPRVQLGPFIEINTASRDLGIQPMSAPKKPKFSCLDARLRSYSKWPIPDIQRPEVLAQAGFYYQYVDDQVRCFHCNGGLRSWQKEDDPWFEHGKWFPHCHFLKLIKGPNYVNEVQDTCRKNNSDSTNPNSTNAIATNSEILGDVLQSANPTLSLDMAMSSPIVQRALEMGLNEGRVLNAVRRQLEFNGKSFDTTEELVEVVLESQAEEEDDNSELSSSIVREVSRILNNIFSPSDFENDIASPSSEDENFLGFANFEQSYPNSDTGIQISQSDSTLPLYNSSDENLRRHSISASVENNINENLSEISTKTSIASAEPSSSAESSNSKPIDLEKQISLEEENRKLKDARLCKVCMDDEVGVVFLPCGHLVVCAQCATGMQMCPLCRSPIRGFVRTFLS